MGQVFHGCAKTTHAVRAELQRSKALVAALAGRFGINPKTVLKWRKRTSVQDSRMGFEAGPIDRTDAAGRGDRRLPPINPAAARRRAVHPAVPNPHLSRPSLHWLLERHGISRLPKDKGMASKKKRFKNYPIGFVHIYLRGWKAVPLCYHRSNVEVRLCRPAPRGDPFHRRSGPSQSD